MIGGVTRSSTGQYAANIDLRTWRSRVAEACFTVLGGRGKRYVLFGILTDAGDAR